MRKTFWLTMALMLLLPLAVAAANEEAVDEAATGAPATVARVAAVEEAEPATAAGDAAVEEQALPLFEPSWITQPRKFLSDVCESEPGDAVIEYGSTAECRQYCRNDCKDACSGGLGFGYCAQSTCCCACAC